MSGAADPFTMPMAEAVDYFRQKVRMPTRQWTDLWEGAHARAFAVAGVQRDDLLAGIKGAIEKALKDGTTLEEFRRDLAPMADALGWRARGRAYEGWRTRLVYQANLNAAYAAGRYAQMTEPETLEALPFWAYRHSRKRDPRPEHLAWDGKVLEASDAWWRTHYPPNGWGCGCWAEPLSRRQLRALGKAGPDEAPDDGSRPWVDPVSGERRMVPNGIDPGWAHNHGQGWLDGAAPTELREDLRPRPSAGEPQAPTRLPSMPQPRPMDATRIMEAGLPDEAYLKVFLEEFGATSERPALFRDVTGTRLAIGRELFTERGTGRLKIRKQGRERYVRLIADAIKDPDEVWADWVTLENGEIVLRRRYLRLAGLGGKSNPFTVVEWTARGWLGTTAFATRPPYQDRERTGVLLFRRAE